MNKSRFFGLLACFIILSVSAAYATPPKIGEFKVQSVFPHNIQFSWDVSSSDGLKELIIFSDGKEVYSETLTGLHHVSTYQIADDNTTHKYELSVYNQLDEVTTVSKTKGGDVSGPKVISDAKVVSNQKIVTFTTDEIARCKIGFGKNTEQLVPVGPDYNISHSTEFPVKDGANKLYITCIDEDNNEMKEFFTLTFVYDAVAPSTVANITYDGKTNIVSWAAATDSNGVDQYVIYNAVGEVDSVDSTSWNATNESTVFITAVDSAGNEGAQASFDLARAKALSPDYTVEKQKVDEKNVVVVGESKKEPAGPTMDTQTTKYAWIAFGVLLLIFIGWKIYERKTDKFGLHSYLKQRRKMHH